MTHSEALRILDEHLDQLDKLGPVIGPAGCNCESCQQRNDPEAYSDGF